MLRKYYLEDEYFHNTCDCVQKHGACVCEVSENGRQQHIPREPKEREDLMYTRTSKIPLYSPSPITSREFEVRDNKSPVLKRYSPAKRNLNVEHAGCCENSADKTVSPLESHEPLYFTTATQREAAPVYNKEILSGQFPCPCMSVDMNDLKSEDPCDVHFYNWWGWSWLKERENDWRAKMENEGKRFSEEFPIALANYYTAEKYGRYQPEREMFPRTVPETERAQFKQSSYYDVYGTWPRKTERATRSPANVNGKQEKRRSLVKTLNNAFKALMGKERKSVVVCECATKLNICGPNKKPCGGLEGVLMPCGFDCDCEYEQKCLAPYMKDLCPCGKCRCPREHQHVPTATGRSQDPREHHYLPMAERRTLDHRENQYVPMAERRTPSPRQNQYVPMAERTTQAAIYSTPSSHFLEEYPEDDHGGRYTSSKKVHATNTEESIEVISYSMQKLTADKEECCCSCDEELCPCWCCRDFQEVRSRKMQTSHCYLHEKCTQTEKVPRKCCRCCKCCSSKGKRQCFKCMEDFPTNDDDSGGASPGDKHRSYTKDRPGSSKTISPNNHVTTNTGGRSTNQQFNVHHSTSPILAGMQIENSTSLIRANRHINNATSPVKINGHDNITSRTKCRSNDTTSPIMSKQRVDSKHKPTNKFVRNSCENKKTTMVRTNSVQCIPARENKATSYSYEDQYSSSQLDSVISQLHSQLSAEVSARNVGDFDKPSIRMDADDINALTSAKLRNFFLEGDIYSSPVSGKHYDLSYRSVDAIPATTSTKHFKPLDVNEQLQCSQFSMQCFSAEAEHTKLMSAICEAILSNQDNLGALEEPTKEVNPRKIQDASGDSKQPKIEVLHTIKEDSESLSSATSCCAADEGNNKKSSDKTESENTIFEMQRSFKHTIDKLEEKMELLMSNIRKNIGHKAKTERSRSRSPPKSKQSDQNPKKVIEYKPPITKTGLFGAIPSRSQLFAQGSPKVHHANAKSDRDPVKNYENLVQANQRHIDELLTQLDALHSCNVSLDKSQSPGGETAQSCGLEIRDSNKNFEPEAEDENASFPNENQCGGICPCSCIKNAVSGL